MTVKVEHSTVIDRPPAEVFRFVSDAHNDHLWETGVERCVPDRPPEVGQRRSFVMKIMGRRQEGTASVTVFEPECRLTIEATAGPVDSRTTYHFRPVNGGTRVDFVSEAELPGPLKVLGPLLDRLMQKQWEGDLATLKRLLEE